MARRSFTWTEKQLDKLSKVIEVLDELNDYKPLTHHILICPKLTK